jgi:hypothetical protein
LAGGLKYLYTRGRLGSHSHRSGSQPVSTRDLRLGFPRRRSINCLAKLNA